MPSRRLPAQDGHHAPFCIRDGSAHQLGCSAMLHFHSCFSLPKYLSDTNRPPFFCAKSRSCCNSTLCGQGRLVLAPRGLTGLLNPLSIWHKIISAVFHGLFQLCFSHLCWSRSAP